MDTAIPIYPIYVEGGGMKKVPAHVCMHMYDKIPVQLNSLIHWNQFFCLFGFFITQGALSSKRVREQEKKKKKAEKVEKIS